MVRCDGVSHMGRGLFVRDKCCKELIFSVIDCFWLFLFLGLARDLLLDLSVYFVLGDYM